MNANPPRTPEEEFEKWADREYPGCSGSTITKEAYLAGYRAALERAAEICRTLAAKEYQKQTETLTDRAMNRCTEAILKELK